MPVTGLRRDVAKRTTRVPGVERDGEHGLAVLGVQRR